MNRALSQKMRFLTFISIIMLGYVHGYNLNETYLSPISTVQENLTLTTFLEYFLANGFLRFRIPLLFLISGYLYAYYDQKPWKQRTARRFSTLIIPYLWWSAIGLAITFLLQQWPYTERVVAATQLDQLGDNRPYVQIGWMGIMFRWLLAPISFQLWFILSLFIYNAAYPALMWLLKKIPAAWLGLTFILWFSQFNLGLIGGTGLFFFSLGIWLQKKQYSIADEPRWFSLGLTWIFFIGICCIKTFMAFELPHQEVSTFILIGVFYQLAVLAGILAIWFSVDRLVIWWNQQPMLKSWMNHSFFVYGLHIPLLAYIMRGILLELGYLPYVRLVSYLLVPLVFMLLALALAAQFKKYWPWLYKNLTGGRGL